MATLGAPATAVSPQPSRTRRLSVASLVVPFAVAVSLLGAAVALVMPPPILHPLLDAAGSAAYLGVSSAEAHRLSDLTVTQLVQGPGTFDIAGPSGRPLYDAAEIGHLRDARVLLYGSLLLAVVCGAGIAAGLTRTRDEARALGLMRVRRAAAGLVLGIGVLGVVAAVAFEPAFELFHRVFFPGGNYAFDPSSQRLVQLYPIRFWQLVAGLVGVIAAVLGVLTWWLAGRGVKANLPSVGAGGR